LEDRICWISNASRPNPEVVIQVPPFERHAQVTPNGTPFLLYSNSGLDFFSWGVSAGQGRPQKHHGMWRGFLSFQWGYRAQSPGWTPTLARENDQVEGEWRRWFRIIYIDKLEHWMGSHPPIPPVPPRHGVFLDILSEDTVVGVVCFHDRIFSHSFSRSPTNPLE